MYSITRREDSTEVAETSSAPVRRPFDGIDAQDPRRRDRAVVCHQRTARRIEERGQHAGRRDSEQDGVLELVDPRAHVSDASQPFRPSQELSLTDGA